MLPFFTFGILLIISGLMAAFVMPAPNKVNNPAGELEKSSGGLMPGFITLLQIPTVALASFSILVASISLGFINSTLYAHLQQVRFIIRKFLTIIHENSGIHNSNKFCNVEISVHAELYSYRRNLHSESRNVLSLRTFMESSSQSYFGAQVYQLTRILAYRRFIRVHWTRCHYSF